MWLQKHGSMQRKRWMAAIAVGTICIAITSGIVYFVYAGPADADSLQAQGRDSTSWFLSRLGLWIVGLVLPNAIGLLLVLEMRRMRRPGKRGHSTFCERIGRVSHQNA